MILGFKNLALIRAGHSPRQHILNTGFFQGHFVSQLTVKLVHVTANVENVSDKEIQTKKFPGIF